MQKERPWLVIAVRDDDVATRLDLWLCTEIPGLSRKRAKELIGQGDVTLNGSRAKKSAALKPGDEVIIWSEPTIGLFEPAPDSTLELKVLYEDEHVLAVDKPSGIPSVPLSPKETGTHAGAIVARYPECAAIGKSSGDGGMIQRLDLETSGVVLVARSERVFDLLAEIQNRSGIEKRYIAATAISSFDLPEVVDEPLVAAGPGGKKVKTSPGGEPAVTKLMSLETLEDKMLIEATIFKGKRHQIRVHLANAGFPIIGDELYGEATSAKASRLFLHAHQVKLNHPVTGEELIVTSPLPDEFGPNSLS